MLTDQAVLTVGYDIENTKSGRYKGEVTVDHYGRKIPKHAHGTVNFEQKTSSTKLITDSLISLYDKTVNRELLIRRINISFCKLIPEKEAKSSPMLCTQLDIFTDPEELIQKQNEEKKRLTREKNMQKTLIELKKRFGKNIILRGTNFEEGATARMRNAQIGGHRA